MAIIDSLTPDTGASTDRSGLPDLGVPWRSLIAALVVVYVALSLVSSPDGHLLTDVGGKAASLEAMRERGDWNPDIGYAFADLDPDGRFHPLDYTAGTADGSWVNTTSLTMIYLMKPLYDLGGAQLAVLVAVLGGVLVAVSAAFLERRLDPSSDGKWSFVLVGLSSSTVVYTMDLWEHTLGLAAIGFGTVATLDALAGRQPLRSAAIAGLLYGFAATMRQEALVYGFVAGIVLVAGLIRMRSFTTVAGPAFAMLAGTAVPLALHTLVEVLVLGGPLRLQRSVRTAADSGGQGSGRLDGALTTTINLLNGTHPIRSILGIVFVALTVVTVQRHLQGRGTERLLRVVGALGVAALIGHAVPAQPITSLFVATPLALLGAIVGVSQRAWKPLALGLAPIPLVVLTQFPAGHAFQWGGRYLLGSALVLTVLAVCRTRRRHQRLLRFFVAASVLATAYGVPWAFQRIEGVSHDRAELVGVIAPDEVTVWRSPTIAREFGSLSIGRPWLSASRRDDQIAVAAMLRDQQISSFVLVVERDHPGVDFPGYVKAADRGELANFGHRIELWTRG